MEQVITTIVIDDEPHSRNELMYLLGEYKEIKIVAEADSGEKGLELVMRHSPDVVFVDIEMSEMTGIELAEILKNSKKPPIIIFATAYTNYAAKAFRVQALDYLVKPFDEEQLAETIERIKEQLEPIEKDIQKQQETAARLAVDDQGRIVYLDPNDITYLFREERETIICTQNRTFRVKTPIKELEEKLRGYPFFRTHKSYLVNLNYVEQLIPWFNGAYQVKVVGKKEEIPVSRNYVKSLREQVEL